MEERIPFDDAHVEAQRGRFKVKVPEDLVCEFNNQIVKMCINPACTMTSLICDQKNCRACLNSEH